MSPNTSSGSTPTTTTTTAIRILRSIADYYHPIRKFSSYTPKIFPTSRTKQPLLPYTPCKFSNKIFPCTLKICFLTSSKRSQTHPFIPTTHHYYHPSIPSNTVKNSLKNQRFSPSTKWQNWHFEKKWQNYSTQYSRVVPHHSTD